MQARPARPELVSPGQIDVHGRDMSVCVAADVLLRDLQAQLASHEQWLPIDGSPDASIGELVQSNSTGPLRLGFGAWRDLLLGCQFRNLAGELISAGGRTMKNVAGYDLTKFMVGQRGAFGQIVTLTIRTYRKPTGAILATFKPDLALVAQLIPSDLRPQWMLLDSQTLMCGYLGDPATLAFYQAKIPSLNPIEIESRTLEQDIAGRAARWTVLAHRRVSIPPADVLRFVAQNQITQWIADPAFGIVLIPRESRLAAGQADDSQRALLLNRLKTAFGQAGAAR